MSPVKCSLLFATVAAFVFSCITVVSAQVVTTASESESQCHANDRCHRRHDYL
jgi:hypothetical protein